MSKMLASLEEAVRQCGVKDGMTLAFHHHFREGDLLLNMVMAIIDKMGIKDITIDSTGIFDVHKPLVDLMKRKVVTGIRANYMSSVVGRAVCAGLLQNQAEFRSHGGHDAALSTGETHIDVAFVAAPCSDYQGNCSGIYGEAACGPLGYAWMSAWTADKTVVVTDTIMPYPTHQFSIPETCVDYVVKVDQIGIPSGILSGITRITRDPVGLAIARYAATAIEHSGHMNEGFNFQTGGGGISLAASQFMKQIMQRKGIKGGAIIGGITGYLVDLLESGCFHTIFNGQCLDVASVASLRDDPRHMELPIYHYASPAAKSTASQSLDVCIIGATQLDTDFNVNVNTDSQGYIIGGSGGNTDIAVGAKLTVAVAPLIRARMPIIVDKVVTKTTPGEYVDMVVTQRGVAVNPRRPEVKERLKGSGLKLLDINRLKDIAYEISGEPEPLNVTDVPVAKVFFRTKILQDIIYKVR